MDDLVSIIIPCYNAETTLEKCINSILRQDYCAFEIVAVNDGSTDQTRELLNRLSNKDGRIIVIDKENGGVSVARNAGLQMAHGKYIAFVDADDCVEEQFLRKLVLNIEDADFSVCLYSCSIGHYVSSTNVSTLDDLFQEMMIPRNNIAAFVWNRLYRGEIIRNNSLHFMENVFACEDTLFNFQYMMCSQRFGICKEPLYYYNINNSSAMFNKKFNKRKISANIAYEYMLDHSKNQSQRQWVEIAAMWFNLILKRQLYNSNYKASEEEINSINKMLKLNSKAFMGAPIPVKYKLAYPFWKIR